MDRIINLLAPQGLNGDSAPAPKVLRPSKGGWMQKGAMGSSKQALLEAIRQHPGARVQDLRPLLIDKVPATYLKTSIYTSLKELTQRGELREGENRTYYPVSAGEETPKTVRTVAKKRR